jgi:hypothetical protein
VAGRHPARPKRPSARPRRSFRTSARTTSFEQAEALARQYEQSAAGGKDMEAAMELPTVTEGVTSYLADARARGLAPATLSKLTHIFRAQFEGWCEEEKIKFLRDLNARNLTEWRATWKDDRLARKKKFERVVGFFWFCVRQGVASPEPHPGHEKSHGQADTHRLLHRRRVRAHPRRLWTAR